MKKAMRILIAAALMILLCTAVSAAETVTVSLPSFPVTLNGVVMDTEYEEYPVIVYQDITYFPMTYYGARWMGLSTAWDAELGLGVEQNDAEPVYRSYPAAAKNRSWDYAQIPAFPITVNGKQIDNGSEPYPLLLYRDVTYFPMTWRFIVTEFKFVQYEFSHENGLIIASRDTDRPIQTGENEAVWGKWRWYTDSGKVLREPQTGGAAEVMFQSEEDTRGPLKLFAHEDNIWLEYYAGGAVMGGNRLHRFSASGARMQVAAYYSQIILDGDTYIAVRKPTPPNPGNLTISRDRGATWQTLGDEAYCYGCAVMEEDEGWISYQSNQDMTLHSGYLYVLGISDLYAEEVPSAVVCRIDLKTGKNKEITGPAVSFRIDGDKLVYTDPNGKEHSVTPA